MGLRCLSPEVWLISFDKKFQWILFSWGYDDYDLLFQETPNTQSISVSLDFLP